ncbi:DNA alkylation repair protein [Marinomonas posidonica]|uniref:Heat domain containing protein n=1 Tax=Marinomonas posidonica (strain CECT 7376 / NCIMB 14433 / IVIA-Po-181) TaxID=491952 RepID=F6CXW3_MARPP|nr:DNA alkylation repair protein [Marinomonas posidonica]AEF54525.1 heat domain containing protein [Marinomonas posidonica IVIA-Po-181]
MPELFKDKFNPQVIESMAAHFQAAWSEFDQVSFVDFATNDLANLELKERSKQITEAMFCYLPNDFTLASDILFASLRPYKTEDIYGLTPDNDGIVGWAIMPMADYVGWYGQGHPDLSMALLKEMTKRFSSEFGIRHFLLSENKSKTLATLKEWTTDDNYHVRRLVSEGIRPRLPWAMQLPDFIANPMPVIELLETLKDDPEEYVRRSVANNLNDIAKDHPDLAANIALKWMADADENRKKLIRHACRTLLKQSHPTALQVFGYLPVQVKKAKLKIATPTVYLNEHLEFELHLVSDSSENQSLMIDYIIHHQKKNGVTSPKVYKGKKVILKAGNTLNFTKRHPFKQVTTRVYYPGQHAVEIIVNGVSIAKSEFQFALNNTP